MDRYNFDNARLGVTQLHGSTNFVSSRNEIVKDLVNDGIQDGRAVFCGAHVAQRGENGLHDFLDHGVFLYDFNNLSVTGLAGITGLELYISRYRGRSVTLSDLVAYLIGVHSLDV